MKVNNEHRFGLIGHPLGQSISPQIHQRLMEIAGIRGDYSLIDIVPEVFERKTVSLKNLSGFNVTIPYKRAIVPFLSGISEKARRCGAVNTVKCDGGGMYGFNTDSEGFVRSLEKAGIPLKGHVLVLGAGGVSRMMACEALAAGCEVVIASRHKESADSAKLDLLKQFPNAIIDTQNLGGIDSGFDLIVNGTPAGMYPDTQGCPLRSGVAGKSAAVFDAIYNPRQTVLLKEAAAGGAKTLGGLSMLVRQAAAAQEIWNGIKFNDGDIAGLISQMSALISSRYGG